MLVSASLDLFSACWWSGIKVCFVYSLDISLTVPWMLYFPFSSPTKGKRVIYYRYDCFNGLFFLYLLVCFKPMARYRVNDLNQLVTCNHTLTAIYYTGKIQVCHLSRWFCIGSQARSSSFQDSTKGEFKLCTM